MKEILIGLFLGAIIAFFIVILTGHAEAQNCPLDWHPPPCGIPPDPIKQAKKDAARWRSYAHDKAKDFFVMYTAGACALERQGYKPAKLACGAGVLGIGAADIAKRAEDRVASDPWDPNYQELYTGRFLSYDELGLILSDTGDDYVNQLLANIAEHTQMIDMLADRIGVSVDRANSCVQAGIDLHWYLGCEVWQAEWAQANLIWLGERYQAKAASMSAIADYLSQYEGQGVNPDFVDLLDEDAAWDDWAGSEFQQ